MFVRNDLLTQFTFPGFLFRRMVHAFFRYLSIVESEEHAYVSELYSISEDHDIFKDVLTQIGPFVVNTALALMLGTLAWLKGLSGAWLILWRVGLVWLAISLAMHAFPSRLEAKHIWKLLQQHETPWAAKLVGGPLAMIMLAGSFGSAFRLDLVYGVIIGLGLPWLMVG